MDVLVLIFIFCLVSFVSEEYIDYCFSRPVGLPVIRRLKYKHQNCALPCYHCSVSLHINWVALKISKRQRCEI